MAPFWPPSDPDPSAEPWAVDPDAWRTAEAEACAPATGPARTAWPQLGAAPLYWMWLERLEQQRDDAP